MKSDLYEVLRNTLNGTLASNAPLWHQDSSAVTVVMASAGYPGSYEKGVQITGTLIQSWERWSLLCGSICTSGSESIMLTLYRCDTNCPSGEKCTPDLFPNLNLPNSDTSSSVYVPDVILLVSFMISIVCGARVVRFTDLI